MVKRPFLWRNNADESERPSQGTQGYGQSQQKTGFPFGTWVSYFTGTTASKLPHCKVRQATWGEAAGLAIVSKDRGLSFPVFQRLYP
jgi:hypothetical protein